MQQFGATAFYTVVHQHKLREVDVESTLHDSIAVSYTHLTLPTNREV